MNERKKTSVIETQHETRIIGSEKTSERNDFEINRESDTEKRVSKEKLSAIREKLKGTDELKTVEPSQKKIAAYQERYLPDYLANKEQQPAPFSWAFRTMLWMKEKLGRVRVEGREQVPEKGGYLVVANHSGGETGALYGTFNQQPLRIASGEELNWKRSKFRAWMLRKFGMLPVRESLSNLSGEEKTALIERVPGDVRKKAYGGIIDREKDPKATLVDAKARMQFVRAAVAALSRGDVVAVFPEGLFLYGKDKVLRKAYGGIEILAHEFEKLTGKPLPLLPVGISKKSITIGESFFLNEKTDPDIRDADWAMQHVAQLLPKEERGYYDDTVK